MWIKESLCAFSEYFPSWAQPVCTVCWGALQMSIFWQYLHFYMHVTCSDNKQLLNISRAFVLLRTTSSSCTWRDCWFHNCVRLFRANFTSIILKCLEWVMYFRQLLDSLTWGGHAACSIYFQRHRSETWEHSHPTFCSLLFHSGAHCSTEIDFHRDVNFMQIPCLFILRSYVLYLYFFIKESFI